MNGIEALKESMPSVDMDRVETIRERLQRRRTNIANNLAAIDEAIKMLDENPSFEKVHDAINRAGY